MNKIFLSFFIIFLFSCGRELDSGEIIEKVYEPAYQYVQFIPMAISCGNNCTTTMQIPYVVYIDESWAFIVKGENKENKQITEKWYVDKNTYDSIDVGLKRKFESLNARLEPNSNRVEKSI